MATTFPQHIQVPVSSWAAASSSLLGVCPCHGVPPARPPHCYQCPPQAQVPQHMWTLRSDLSCEQYIGHSPSTYTQRDSLNKIKEWSCQMFSKFLGNVIWRAWLTKAAFYGGETVTKLFFSLVWNWICWHANRYFPSGKRPHRTRQKVT